MSDSNDISSLYRQFGGDPGQYQEIGRSKQAIAARERWPLLAAIQPGQGSVPPAVGAEPADSALPHTAWPPAAMPEPFMLFPAEPATAPAERLSAASPLYAASPVRGQDLPALPRYATAMASLDMDPASGIPANVEHAPIETAVADAQAAEPHVVPVRLEPFMAAMAANQANELAPALLRSVPMDTPQAKAVPPSTAQDAGQPAPSLQSVFARLAKPPRDDVHAETRSPLSKSLAK